MNETESSAKGYTDNSLTTFTVFSVYHAINETESSDQGYPVKTLTTFLFFSVSVSVVMESKQK